MISFRLNPILLLLAFFSGACGIAYEVLYSRLLGTYFGHIYYVAGAILSCYLLMLGAGSFVAYRWRRYLWLIEILLGVYAAVLALVCNGLQDWILTHVSPLAASPARILVCIFIVLVVPAALSGFSVPLFSSVLDEMEGSTSGRHFRVIYFLYNLGAGVFVILIEFILLRRLGMRETLFTMALLNFVIGAVMWRIQYRQHSLERLSTVERAPSEDQFPRVSIFILAILSGAFQLLMLRVAAAVFGPFQENFALVVALTLASIATGTALVQTTKCSFSRFLILGSIAVPVASC